MKPSLFVLVLFISFPAFAQYVVRNGGYTVQCLDARPKTLEIMEGEAQGFAIHYSSKRSYLAKAADLISRISLVDAGKSQKYTAWLKEWKSQIIWMPELDLYSPADKGTVVLPFKHCRERIGIVQINETRFGEQKYWINPVVWNNLDEDQKAALLLHELIYRDLLEEHPESNAFLVRKINLKIHTVDIAREKKSFAELLSLL
ncbi:hypothetical protein QJS83_08625 [Bdellovibrio sp. 22V]|uniref:hypothetical protein n=1 Tax=Bdellovibrio sp. 22V TaxID=3044166 RepID=UPI00254323F1|nr:hypothetical protein [Bdellovibrio sp. 22V]WII73939.1 hypothetical protein QJS83_08625 [Bdellovibrio sp. 22V]